MNTQNPRTLESTLASQIPEGMQIGKATERFPSGLEDLSVTRTTDHWGQKTSEEPETKAK